jgi:glucosamine 6-phosphate synthetase-like amidotransferase/phosphosugar isomerase protein
MCGIAGYSLRPSSTLDRTLAAQALLAGIAERGADAVGYAHRAPGGPIVLHKQRSRASALLDRIEVPASATETLLHVRDYTKGHPRIEANNHPVTHGAVVGVHNGIILNDEEILARHRFQRQEPEMTVDSEAIFALADAFGAAPTALEQLTGSMATAWLDERHQGTVVCARGVRRPLWLGQGAEGVLFASTAHALELAERYLRLALELEQVPEGTILELEHGRVARRQRFRPDDAFEERSLPAVRAPQEAAFCLSRLAALAAL